MTLRSAKKLWPNLQEPSRPSKIPGYAPAHPKKNKLMISGEIMRCRKVRRMFRYHVSNQLLSSENLLMICCFFFSLLEMKTNRYEVFHQYVTTNCARKESRML